MASGRTIQKIVAILGLAFVALLLGCIVVLRTVAFRDFLRSEVARQASARLGVAVTVGSVEVRWTNLDIALNQIVVASPPAAGIAEPLLTADRLEAGLRFGPLLRRQVEFSRLELDGPVLRLFVDAQGRSNLPVLPQSNGGGLQRLFDLRVSECAIRSGELYYNDREIPLDAQVHGLKFSSAYEGLTASYVGSVAYENGSVSGSPQFAAVRHSLQAEFTAKRSALSLHPLVIASGASRITAGITLKSDTMPSVAGQYDAVVSGRDVAEVLREPSLPTGIVALSGKFSFQQDPRRSILETIRIQGRASSTRMEARTAQRSLAATAVRASYELKDANLTVHDFVADIFGGEARGNLQMRNLSASKMQSTLIASLKGVSLAELSAALAPPGVQRASFVGTSDADVSASWSGSIGDLRMHAHAAISAPPQTVSAGGSVPVKGMLDLDYDAPQDLIAFRPSEVDFARTRLTVSGALSAQRSGNSSIAVNVTSTDLTEVESLAQILQAAFDPSVGPPNWPSVGGAAQLNARVTGSTSQPRIQGQLAAQNLVVDRSEWRALALSLDASPPRIAIENGLLTGTARDQFSFRGDAGLQNWQLTPTSPIHLQASTANMPLAAAEALLGRHDPVNGTISAKLSIGGTRESPAGNASVVLVHGAAWNEPIDNFTLNADSQGGTIHSHLEMRLAAGMVAGDATWSPETGRYTASLSGNGLKLDRIAALQKAFPAQGSLNLSASGAGTLNDPQLDASLSIPQLQLQGQTLSDVAGEIHVAHEHASLQLHSTVDQGQVDAKGDVALTGARNATVTLDVRSLPVAAIAANFKPLQDLKLGGQTDLHLAVNGPLENPGQIDARLEIPAFSVTSGKVQLSLVRSLQAEYRSGTLTISPAQIQGTGTNLSFGGTIPIVGSAPYSLVADGSLDLSVLQEFVPGIRSSGQAEIHIQGQGRNAGPNVRGNFQIRNAMLTSESLPVGIEGVNADINLSGTRAEIARFSGAAGGGTVDARGYLELGQQKIFNVELNANSVRLRYPTGLRSVLNGRLNLSGGPDKSALTGRVVVDSLSFTQEFDLAKFANSFSEESAGSTSSPFDNNMTLRIAVVSEQNLNLASSKLSLGGSANLNIVGTLAQPVVLGRINVASGDVFFLGKHFQVESGTIGFANPARTEPVINAYITTTVEQYNLTLKLTGPVERLRTSYTSDPSLPPADIIHLLAFGNTTAEAASAPTQSAGATAESVLAQGVSSQVAGKLESITGLSQISIDPLATNSYGNTAAQIAIQERVTGNILFTFSTDVTSTQGQTVELKYNISKPWSVTVLRDQNGGYGVDVRLHKTF